MRGFRARLITLTLPAYIVVDGRAIEPVGPLAYRYMAQRFNVLMATLRERYPGEYIRVVEEQKRGAPHYHLIHFGHRYIDKRELSRLAQQAGLGRVVDVSLVRSHKRVAQYVLKYALKDAAADYVPYRMRYYSYSRDFGAETRDDANAEKAARRIGWTFAYLPRLSDESRVVLVGLGFEVEEPEDPPGADMVRAALVAGLDTGVCA